MGRRLIALKVILVFGQYRMLFKERIQSFMKQFCKDFGKTRQNRHWKIVNFSVLLDLNIGTIFCCFTILRKYFNSESIVYEVT